MTSTETHKKHAAIPRPGFGEYGRNELALIGAPCGVIQSFADTITKALETKWQIAYVDADHASNDTDPSAPFAGNARLTDKIGYRQFDSLADPNAFQRRMQLDSHDLILINGNHFKGKEQIIFIDPKKEDSLHRKLERLTDVQMVITTSPDLKPYGFLKDVLNDQIPIHDISETEAIQSWLEAWLTSRIPTLNGLILAGGKSQRMGHDKTVIDYHGMPHWEYLAKTLRVICEETFVSRRSDQDALEHSEFGTIEDVFLGLGPFGGIVSAFQKDPDKAWLVIAADLPFADLAVDRLIAQRDSSKMATAFHNAKTGFPDPLMTIWEPRAYPVLLQFLAQGHSCPRKALINSDIHTVEPDSEDWLLNVNKPEDLDKAKMLIADK